MSYRVPVALEAGAPGAVRWCASDGARFTEPFFDDTLRRLRRAGVGPALPPSTLDVWAGPPPSLPPVTLILHISRCGSTLLSQRFAAKPDHLVVSEARICDDILRGACEGAAVTDVDRARWLRHAASAFVEAQATPPGRLVIKCDAWHLFALPLVRQAFPEAPLLFVYRHPLEVLVSLMAQPSLTIVRDTVSPEEMGIPRAERDGLSPAAHAAAILGAFFRQALRHRPWLTPIDYASMPVAAMNAKRPGEPFVPDAARKRTSASSALREACARWAEPAYQAWRASL